MRDFEARLRRLTKIPSQTIFVDSIVNDTIGVRVCVSEEVVSTFIDVKISSTGQMKVIRIAHEAELTIVQIRRVIQTNSPHLREDFPEYVGCL